MAEEASYVEKNKNAKADKVVQLRALPAGDQPAGDPARREGFDTDEAFIWFGDLSQQLTDSYQWLEQRVEALSGELSAVTGERSRELEEKDRIANRLENLINFLPGGVVVLDSRGRVSEANPGARDFLGEPLEGELWRQIIGRVFQPRQDDGHEVSLQDGRRLRIATRNLGGDGQIILLTDLTETRRLQSELSRHERLSALGKMLSALAHQIRTPLATAMLYAGHLRRDELNPERRREFAGKLCNRLNHMERQIQDMLLFVKGELPLNEQISVSDLAQGFLEALEVPLSQTGSVCEHQMESADRVLRCNREALIGALLNLANNSMEAQSRPTRLALCFSERQAQGRTWLCIELSDNGPGIDPALLPQVADLFVTTKSQGTGLGLAVVQAVAKAHGGRLDLQSSPGEGTRARVWLPL